MKALGRRALLEVASWFPQLDPLCCSYLRGQQPFCPLIPGCVPPARTVLPALPCFQHSPQIPGGPGSSSAGERLNLICNGRKVRTRQLHCRDWGQWGSL